MAGDEDESNLLDDTFEDIKRWEVPYFKPENEKREKYMDNKGSFFTKKIMNMMSCCTQR